MKTIRSRVLAGFGITLAVLMIPLGLSTHVQIRDTVIPLTRELGQEVVKARAAEVGRLMQGYANDIATMAETDILREGNPERIGQDLIRHASAYNPDYEMVFFADPEGRFITSTGATGDVRDREYWRTIMARRSDMALSNPLISKASGHPVIVVAHATDNDRGQRTGLIAATVLLNTLSTIAGSIHIGERGFGWVADASGLVVAHPDPALRMRLNFLDPPSEFLGLRELGQRMANGEAGMGNYRRPDGTSYLAIFSPVPFTSGWVFGVSMLESELMEAADALMRNNIRLMLSILAPILFLVFLVAGSLSRPVRVAAAAAERIASGDLTMRLESTARDETGALIRALGKMIGYFNTLIGQIQRSSGELVSTANSLSAMSKTQTEEINSLNLTTAEVAAATQEISVTAEELLNTMNGLTHIADHTTELANSGQSCLGEMENAMLALQRSSQAVAERLNQIQEKAVAIGTVTGTITQIADQTNLLSLNASIEAAKAGEYGLGFAVLAREIRQLADQTAVATLNIEDMVLAMSHAVGGGVAEMDRFAGQLAHSVKQTHEINLRFGEIIEQVQILLPQFDSLHEGMRSQSAGALQIRDAMASLTRSVQLSVNTLEATSAASRQLEGAIQALRKEVGIFRLNPDGSS